MKHSDSKLPSSKDEEEKEWNFQEMNSVLSDIASKNSGIGGILSAMIYQIDFNHNSKEVPKEENASGVPPDPSLTKELPKPTKLDDYFGDIFNKLTIEHCLKETFFKH